MLVASSVLAQARGMSENLSTRLTNLLTAEAAILSGAQSYEIGGRRLSRADLATIQREIDKLRHLIARQSLPGTGGFALASLGGAG